MRATGHALERSAVNIYRMVKQP